MADTPIVFTADMVRHAGDLARRVAPVKEALNRAGIHTVYDVKPQGMKPYVQARGKDGRMMSKAAFAAALSNATDNLNQLPEDKKQEVQNTLMAEQTYAEQLHEEQLRNEEKRREDKHAEELYYARAFAAAEEAARKQREKSDAPEGIGMGADEVPEDDSKDTPATPGDNAADTSDAAQEADKEDNATAPELDPNLPAEYRHLTGFLAGYAGKDSSAEAVHNALGQEFFDKIADEGRGIEIGETAVTIHYKDGGALRIQEHNNKLYVTLHGAQMDMDKARDIVRIQKARNAGPLTVNKKGSLKERAYLLAAARMEGMTVTQDSFKKSEWITLKEMLQDDHAPEQNTSQDDALRSMMGHMNDAHQKFSHTVQHGEDATARMDAYTASLKLQALHGTVVSLAQQQQLAPEKVAEINAFFENDEVNTQTIGQAYNDLMAIVDTDNPLRDSAEAAINAKITGENAERDQAWRQFKDTVESLKPDTALHVAAGQIAQADDLDSAENFIQTVQNIKHSQSRFAAAQQQQSAQGRSIPTDYGADTRQAAPHARQPASKSSPASPGR